MAITWEYADIDPETEKKMEDFITEAFSIKSSAPAFIRKDDWTWELVYPDKVGK